MQLWHLLVLLYILIAHGLFQYLLKSIVHLPTREKRFFLQYVFCAVVSTGVAVYLNSLEFSFVSLAIFVLGFFNGMAAYAQWKATEISQSKNALFTIFDDFIAVALGFIVFNEGKHLNPGIIAGIVLSIMAVVLFGLRDYRKKRIGTKEKNMMLYAYVAFYSIIWGIAIFMMKYFGVALGVEVSTFLYSWYCGALIAALIILSLEARKKRVGLIQKVKAAFTARNMAIASVLGLCILVPLGIEYWIYLLVPLIVVQPIFLISAIVVPSLIGLFWFKEKSGFDSRDWILFLIGLAGGILIAISY